MEPCLLSGVSSSTTSSNASKYLVLHATPTNLCDHPIFKSSECIQMPLETFSNKTGAPYFLPFSFASLDGIIYQGVVNNVLDISRTIFEVKRVLKPNGTFTFDATHRSVWTWIYHSLNQRLLGLYPARLNNWRLFVTPREATRVLEAYQFSNLFSSSYATYLSLSNFFAGNGFLSSMSITNTDTISLHYCMRARNSEY